MALEELQKQMGVLEQTADSLVEDLKPILRDCPEQPKTTGLLASACATTLGAELQVIKSRLDGVGAALAETRERLGL